MMRRMLRSTGAEISSTAAIGPGLRVPHAQGVIVSHDAVLGAFVTLGQHSTIGGNYGKKDESGRYYPTIGDGVVLTAGVVVGGPIRIGDGVVMGANSVVLKDVPDGAIVGGVPANVLRIADVPTPGLEMARSLRSAVPPAAR